MNELEKRECILNLIKEYTDIEGMDIREDMNLLEDYDQLMNSMDSVDSFIDYFITIILETDNC